MSSLIEIRLPNTNKISYMATYGLPEILKQSFGSYTKSGINCSKKIRVLLHWRVNVSTSDVDAKNSRSPNSRSHVLFKTMSMQSSVHIPW